MDVADTFEACLAAPIRAKSLFYRWLQCGCVIAGPPQKKDDSALGNDSGMPIVDVDVLAAEAQSLIPPAKRYCTCRVHLGLEPEGITPNVSMQEKAWEFGAFGASKRRHVLQALRQVCAAGMGRPPLYACMHIDQQYHAFNKDFRTSLKPSFKSYHSLSVRRGFGLDNESKQMGIQKRSTNLCSCIQTLANGTTLGAVTGRVACKV
eukprot:3469537-Amphidinium_carterae.1